MITRFSPHIRSLTPRVAACIASLLTAFCIVGPVSASGAGWETVEHFAPKTIPAPNPPQWPEDVQLGGVSGMAVNRSGAGGVPPGTLYVASWSQATLFVVARYSPEGDFEMRWTGAGRCGPAEPAHPTCPANPAANAGSVDLDIDQTTGNVYLLEKRLADVGSLGVNVFDAAGSPIAQFGEVNATGTIASNPAQLHSGIPGLAVDEAGKVYVFDEDSTFARRLAIFKPKVPGNFTEYEYGGELLSRSLLEPAPSSPTLDDAGNIYVAGDGYIEEVSSTGMKVCGFTLSAGGIVSMTANPENGEVFFYETKKHLVHRLAPCSGGKFSEAVDTPPFTPTPRRGNIEAMAVNPTLQWPPGTPEHPAGTLYAGAPEPCPPLGACPPDAVGQSSLGYILAQAASHLPEVVSESVERVGSTSATLKALVNPKGAQTSYVFQYMTEVAYQQAGETFNGASVAPLGGAALGSGQQPLLAAVTVSGLQPGTQYRYRVVATGEKSAVGQPESFHTFPAESIGLPNERAWELVSPSAKNGGEVMPAAPNVATCGNECKPGLAAHRFPAIATADGNSVAFQGSPFTFNEGASEYDGYVARRGATGWGTTSLSPALSGDNGGSGFEAFGYSSDLGRAVVFASNPALTPEAAADFRNLMLERVGEPTALTPFVLAPDPQHRVPAGASPWRIVYAGASADFSRQFFEANDALAVSAGPFPVDGGTSKLNLYEWSDGQLRLVNVLPNGETVPGAVFGSGTTLTTQLPLINDFSNVISNDGSRVFWSSESGQVYVREDGESTFEIPDHVGRFLSAAADGSKVLLTDGTVYDLETGTSTDLTGGLGGFAGLVGQSEDLSHIYFVTGPAVGTGNLTSGLTAVNNVQTTSGKFAVGQPIQGSGLAPGTTIAAVGSGTLQLSTPASATGTGVALTAQNLLSGGATNSEGDKAQIGGFNLFSWEAGVGTFIGTLEASDNKTQTLAVWSPAPGRRSAEASPDGRWLAFGSEAELTHQDSVGACEFSTTSHKWTGSVPCEEVFLFDSATGVLRCASCNPAGAAPLGGSFLRMEKNAEGWQPQPRYLTNSGRLYFDSRDSLSSFDTNNGVEDVYQFEPQGVGSCATASGCVSLLSGGRGVYDANFLAMDATGANVFFTTRNRLLPVDTDDLIDLYDAREGGGIPSQSESPPSPCQGEGCLPGPSAPPADPSPSSQSFDGPGNVGKKKHKKKKKAHHKKKHKGGKKKHKGGKKKQKNGKKQKNAKRGRGGSK